MDSKIKRTSFIVQGQVQGVGFRPFIWRLATTLRLTGHTRNTSAGVTVEVQGEDAKVLSFEHELVKNPPPLARIQSLEKKDLPVKPGETDFRIIQSEGHAGQNVLVSPDVGICAECLADIRDPANFRHNYPFANCTNCGPRFTITRSLPYDRPATSMACFELCADCAAEYRDPANRRFHAQPIACGRCGPALWYVDKNSSHTGPTEATRADALARAGRLLLSGGILALKGLGGFQLACDARDSAATRLLRARKNRPHKALAVMARDLAAIRSFCDPTDAHVTCLESPARPIVICPRRPNAPLPLALEIAPDTTETGVMLPYTPLHALLFDWLASHGMEHPVLVMTSANPAGEPICLGNREALKRLPSLADGWLLHDRDILERVDDSVARLMPDSGKGDTPQFLRRARGYVPTPLPLPAETPPVLGVGAELKSTFCLTRSGLAFLGQHIGDLKNTATLDFYEHALAHLSSLLEISPKAIVRDLHPDFVSTGVARDLAIRYSIPLWELQHHAAHAAAVLGENSRQEPALVLCLDGSGLGTDGEIWGGELLFMDLSRCQWHRVGALSNFPLPGGEAAIREPWRVAVALGHSLPEDSPHKPQEKIIAAMLAAGLNCPLTSSAGRLFDAMAALLGLRDIITYEGQAAILLEKAAAEWLASHPSVEAPFFENDLIREDTLWRVDSKAIFTDARTALANGASIPEIAIAFHARVASAFAAMAAKAANELGLRHVGLSGGAFQNRILTSLLISALTRHGLKPLRHHLLPPGDGCISYGQAVWGTNLLLREKLK